MPNISNSGKHAVILQCFMNKLFRFTLHTLQKLFYLCIQVGVICYNAINTYVFPAPDIFRGTFISYFPGLNISSFHFVLMMKRHKLAVARNAGLNTLSRIIREDGEVKSEKKEVTWKNLKPVPPVPILNLKTDIDEPFFC